MRSPPSSPGSAYGLVVSDYLVFFMLFLAVWMLERNEPVPAAFVVVGAVAAAAQLLVKVNGGVLCVVVLALAVWRGTRPAEPAASRCTRARTRAPCSCTLARDGNSLSYLPSWIRISIPPRDGLRGLDGARGSRPFGAIRRGRSRGAPRGSRGRAARPRARPARASRYAVLLSSTLRLLEGRLRASRRARARVLRGRRCGAPGVPVGRPGARSRRPVALVAVLVARRRPRVRQPARSTRFVRPLRPGGARGERASSPRAHKIAAGRARSGPGFALDSIALAELRDNTVDVEPYETSAAWAYGFRWRPELLLQQYVAGDADSTRPTPRRSRTKGSSPVLRQELWPALDGKTRCTKRRRPSWRSCAGIGSSARTGAGPSLHAASTAAEQLVCSPRRRRGRQQRLRYLVRRPRATSCSRGFRSRKQRLQRLQRLVLKRRHEPVITVDSERYRLVPATATGPLILRMPTSAGMSASVGGAVDYSHVGVAGVPSYRVEFYAVTLGSCGVDRRGLPAR